MAAQKENLLSFVNLSGTERNSPTRQHGFKKRPVLLQAGFSATQSNQKLTAMRRWQELKERELKAQQRNRELLQQFEEAQDTLRRMLTLTATMKTIRKEYERYLEENSPRWEKQLKEHTQAAWKKRKEEYSRRTLVKKTEGIRNSLSDRPLLSQEPTAKTKDIPGPQSNNNQNNSSEYNQDGSSHLPFKPSTWLTQPQSQSLRFPIRAPSYQPQPSSHAPQSFPLPTFFPQPHLLPLPHFATHCPPDWGFLPPEYLWSPTAGAAGHSSDSGALWGQANMEEPPPERGEAHLSEEGAGTSRSSSSQREGGGRSRRSTLSQELDVKPVRLSSGHAGSSESSRESDQASSKERKKKRREKGGRVQHSSSGRETPSSKESSRTSSAVIFAAATVAQSSESDASSEKGRRTRRSGGLAVESPRLQLVMKERSRRKDDSSGSHCTGEEVESPVEKSRCEKAGNPDSGSQGEEESGSVSVKIEEESGDETEKDESGSFGLKSGAEKDLGDSDRQNDAREEENIRTDEELEREDEGEENEVSEGKNTTEDDNQTGTEDELGQESEEEEQKLKKEENEVRKQDSASSQDEEGDEDNSEGNEDEIEPSEGSNEEDEGGSEEEEEPRSGKVGDPKEEEDSEDSIVVPQNNRIKEIYAIPEAVEDEEEEEEREEGTKTGSSDDDSNGFSDEDIENLLAPQDQSNKKEEEEEEKKSTAHCDKVKIFQVKECRSTKEDNFSDSDEFDHFYD